MSRELIYQHDIKELWQSVIHNKCFIDRPAECYTDNGDESAR